VAPSAKIGAGSLKSSSTRFADRWFVRAGGYLAVLALMPLLVWVTSYTGLPGPGWMRRYPTSQLETLSKKIDHAYAVMDCGTPPNAARDYSSSYHVASVDELASRVVLHPQADSRSPLAVGDSWDANDPEAGQLTSGQLAMVANPGALVFPGAMVCP